MKKSELKNIIKECVKEVIFEEGVLSGIITEVAQGLGASSVRLQEQHLPQTPTPAASPAASNRGRSEVLSAIGNNGYEEIKKKFKNPELFEGTRPAPAPGEGRGPLSGVAPDDPGIDISNLPGAANWGSVMTKLRK